MHALSAAFFCILPPVIAAFTDNTERVWSICSALLGIQLLWHITVIALLPSSSMYTRLGLIPPTSDRRATGCQRFRRRWTRRVRPLSGWYPLAHIPVRGAVLPSEKGAGVPGALGRRWQQRRRRRLTRFDDSDRSASRNVKRRSRSSKGVV
jgi:hypothetical protein